MLAVLYQYLFTAVILYLYPYTTSWYPFTGYRIHAALLLSHLPPPSAASRSILSVRLPLYRPPSSDPGRLLSRRLRSAEAELVDLLEALWESQRTACRAEALRQLGQTLSETGATAEQLEGEMCDGGGAREVGRGGVRVMASWVGDT